MFACKTKQLKRLHFQRSEDSSQQSDSEKDDHSQIQQFCGLKRKLSQNRIMPSHKSKEKGNKINDAKYQCHSCNRVFANKSNLNRHAKDCQALTSQLVKEGNNLKGNRAQVQTRKVSQSSLSSLSDIYEEQQRLPLQAQSPKTIVFPDDEPQTSRNIIIQQSQANDQNRGDGDGVGQLNFDYLRNFEINRHFIIPFYGSIRQLVENRSPVADLGMHHYATLCYKDKFYRLYNEIQFLHKQDQQIKLSNEYAISELASQKQLMNVIPLKYLVKAPGHIGLVYSFYLYNFGDQQRMWYDPVLTQSFLKKLINGVQEIHRLGYVHRRLNLHNIVVDSNSKDLKIVNFERASLMTNLKTKSYKSKRIYSPISGEYSIGNPMVDSYSVASIIVHSYINRNFQVEIQSQDRFLVNFEIIGYSPNEDQHIKKIIHVFFMTKDQHSWLSLDEMSNLVDQIDFNQSRLC